MTKRGWCVRVAATAGLSVVAATAMFALQQPASLGRWITAWGTSQQGLGTAVVSNATVRLIARVTIPGEAVRIRLDNTFGIAPLVVGKAYVGQRIQGAALAAGSNKPVLFKQSASVTIPPGGTVTSDPVALNVLGQQDLAVSMFLPGADIRPSQHTGAQVTSYLTTNGSGDAAADEAATKFTGTTTSTFWLKSIDVSSSTSTGSIVAFGDSITDGTCTTVDAHDRWVDLLAVRLALDAAKGGKAGAYKALVNEGIGGNTVTREHLQPPPDSPPGLERLDRDVLSHAGVTHVVLFMGTNDARRNAAAGQIIAGLQDIVRRVKARGLKIVGVTMIPRHNRPPAENNTGWNAAKTQVRHEVNQWIRTKAGFDGVIDFDKVVMDPADADLIRAPFNCGDGIHPSPIGYYEMGAAVRLELFK
jgi:lysophospholipase L1-like esterase